VLKRVFWIALAVILLVILNDAVFIVDITEQGVVTQFGKPVKVIPRATLGSGSIWGGLIFKLPFIQSYIEYSAQLLDYDTTPDQVLSRDKKTLIVDNYAKWRIVDPLKLMQTVRTEAGAQSRLDDIIYSVLREEFGQYEYTEIIKTSRSEIMEDVTQSVNRQAEEYGIEVIDVRIKRIDLPQENEQAVYQRMISERERIAQRYRSEGLAEATKTRAEADRTVKEMLAEAYRKAETLKGEGDAEAARIYAEAYSNYPDFYEFSVGHVCALRLRSGQAPAHDPALDVQSRC